MAACWMAFVVMAKNEKGKYVRVSPPAHARSAAEHCLELYRAAYPHSSPYVTEWIRNTSDKPKH